MNNILIENEKFIYSDGNLKKNLLDCGDYLSNKSRIPMSSISQVLTIPGLIKYLLSQHAHISQGTSEEGCIMGSLLVDILMASKLKNTSRPVRVLELGAVSGVLSYHLAVLTGRFHPESKLCCVSNMIGNESGNEWVDRMALVDEPPRLSFVVSDYHDTDLQENSFDIVILNGTADFEDPFAVLKEADRLAKANGLLICYAVDSFLLENSFKEMYESIEEYMIEDFMTIITASSMKSNLHDHTTEDKHEIIRQYVIDMERHILYNEMIDMDLFLQTVKRYLKDAGAGGDTEIKIQLINLREHMINYALFGEKHKQQI